MTANAGRFGFVQPDWARPGAEKPEPWHWEFGYIS
jgi:peptidoglycan DL-endopeptidase CwlO